MTLVLKLAMFAAVLMPAVLGENENSAGTAAYASQQHSCGERVWQLWKHSHPVCVTKEFKVSLIALILGSVVLAIWCLVVRRSNNKLMMQNRSLYAKLQADRAKISADMKKLRSMRWTIREEQRLLLQGIHDRGNVIFDAELGEITLKRNISFSDRSSYIDIVKAELILTDVAEIMRLFPDGCLLIEGHTQGSLMEIPTLLAHELAEARAVLIRDTLRKLGVPYLSMVTLGLPGVLGNNKDDVVLKLTEFVR